MKTQILVILIIGVLTSCQSFISKHHVSEKRRKKETEFVKTCRDQWTYSDLKEKIEIKLLGFQLKSDHQLWHPNFFIGATISGDTIGLIDYDFQGAVTIGDTIEFLPGESRNDTIDGKYTLGHYPLFVVSLKRKHNSILCSVKNVYYAEKK
tara:strand:- start:713 stop:1165 length:453 start_codon:yes stop_codon:yes gene_type:complete